MRLIKQNIERDGSGTVTLFPEEPEDMWHAYNLIAPSDLLRASAIRRITIESATGSTTSSRVHTTLSIRVHKLDFDAQAGQLHVSGRVAEENAYVKTGAYHTLDLALQRDFSLEKAEGWDSIAVDAVREACRERDDAIPAVVMDEGTAAICVITAVQTVLKQRVEVSVTKKRSLGRGAKSSVGNSTDRDKSLQRFYSVVLAALKQHTDLTLPRPLLLASPGFTATNFLTYLLADATSRGDKALLAQKSHFLVLHTSSGHLHSLNQALQSPSIQHLLGNSKFAQETRLMEELMTLIRRDDGRAWYGGREVEKAVARGAVGKGGGVLLISHALFRNHEIGVRRRWVKLVERAKEAGGDVRVLSADHESGRRLEGLGGVAAVLTFPLVGLDEDDEEEEEEGGEGGGNGGAKVDVG